MTADNQKTADPIGDALADDDKPAALRKVGDVAQSYADNAIKYYHDRIGAKRLGARWIRIGALGFGTLAGLTPLGLPLFITLLKPDLETHLKDLLPISALFAAISAAFIAYDKLFGLSSAWMRFVSAELDLRGKRNAFSVAWAKECMHAGPNPTTDQVLASIDVLAAFLASIDGVVRDETQAWVGEFRGALAALEKSVESSRAASATAPPERGAIEVHVLDANTLDDRTWTLQLATQDPIVCAGTASAAATHIAPGQVRVAVVGKLGGASVSAERVVTVEEGKVATVEVTLGTTLPLQQGASKVAPTTSARPA
jgi:hypothetical protein